MGFRGRPCTGRATSRRWTVTIAVLSTAIVLPACSADTQPALTIATATSVEQSGLLGTLLAAYRTESGVDVRSHSTGSGLALQMLARGDAALAISHAPGAEAEAIRSHADWIYRKIAFNEFVIVGPPRDPAGIGGAADAVDAFRRIAQSSARFVSRGDRSGTHESEERLWTLAGQKPGAERLILSGRGMSQALRDADAAHAYTLSDEATFHQIQKQIELGAHYRGDALLLNAYAILFRPGDALAADFARWLTVGHGRSLISSFTVDGRRQYSAWPEGCYGSAPIDLPCGTGGKSSGLAPLHPPRVSGRRVDLSSGRRKRRVIRYPGIVNES